MYFPIESPNYFDFSSENEFNINDPHSQSDCLKKSDINNYCLKSPNLQEDEDDTGIFCDETTKFKTGLNDFLNVDNVNFENNISEDNKSYYSFEKIKLLFEKNEKLLKFLSNFSKCKEIEKAEKKFTKQKRKKEEKNIEEDDTNNIQEAPRNKRGRKPNPLEPRKEHNKMSSDNMIKKAKAAILVYCLKFLNSMLKKGNNGEIKLYKLDYSYINNIKKDKDLDFLKKSLKDLFSKRITNKYKKIDKYYNKTIINRILEREEYVEDYDTIKFIFNMSFSEWLSLFTYKKSINDIINNRPQIVSPNYININKIEESLIKVENLLTNIEKSNDIRYLSIFIYYLFNYECYFETKVGRILKPKEKNDCQQHLILNQ